MNLFNRAVTNLKRQPVKAGILFILIFVLGTVVSATISVRIAILVTEESIILRAPAVSTIQLDVASASEDLGIPWHERHRVSIYHHLSSDYITEVGNSPYVRAYDFYLRDTLFSRDLEWAEIVIDETRLNGVRFDDIRGSVVGSRYWGATMEDLPVVGVHNPDLTDIETGLISLINGRTFTDEEINSGSMRAVVSRAFAEVNNLYIGSVITLESIVFDIVKMSQENRFIEAWHDEEFYVHHEIFEFEIIGIFEVEREVIYENYQGWAISTPLEALSHLNNRIYIPITVAEGLIREKITAQVGLYDEIHALGLQGGNFLDVETEPEIESIFLLNSPRDLDAFTEAANEILPEFWYMGNVTGAFSNIISSMDSVLALADLILLLATGATIVILILIITFLFRERRNEVGIYMALGEKVSKVIGQLLLEIFLVSTVAIILSLFTGNIVSHTLSTHMLEQSLMNQVENDEPTEIPWRLILFNPGELPVEDVLEMYNVSLDTQTIIIFVGMSFSTIALSTIIPMIQVAKTNPKELLTQAKIG